MFDNLEIVTHNKENGKIDRFAINDLKNFYLHETLERVFEKVLKILIQLEIDEIVKKNIEERGIVCIDEFDKIARDVYIYSYLEIAFFSVQSQ